MASSLVVIFGRPPFLAFFLYASDRSNLMARLPIHQSKNSVIEARNDTFEELYSFAIDNAYSIFELVVVSEKLGDSRAFCAWRWNALSSCFL
jgi:hypothetical protein